MARITEKKFAAITVRAWRLIQRLEKLKGKGKTAQYNATWLRLHATLDKVLVATS